MSAAQKRLTAAQVILIAASELAKSGKQEFTEWDLTVAAWMQDRNRFGLRGYEQQHPDHKRVMMEIMGQSKKDNPIRKRFLEKSRPNHYRLTDLGAAEVGVIKQFGEDIDLSPLSPGPIYLAIERYVDSPPFRAWLKNSDEPRNWLGAAAFLELTSNTANTLNDQMRAIESASKRAIQWCLEHGRSDLIRGVHGGSRPIPLDEVEKVLEFLEVLRTRFARQIHAIRQRGSN